MFPAVVCMGWLLWAASAPWWVWVFFALMLVEFL